MKKHLSITLISLIMISSGCETVDLTYPGNNQDLDPQPPRGGIEWADEHKPEGDDEEGQLKENSAPGLTIGTLNATDPNPDDEFTYSISSQKMDGTAVNYFVLNSNSGVTNLELSYGSINFEALTGSKQVDVVILVSDDSPADLDGDFTVKIKVINVNETPYFTNLDQIPRYADEYVDYDSPRIEWTDTDEGDNPSLSDSNLPGWLSIDSEGNIGSSAPPESNDVGNHEFLLTITDDEIPVQEEINIEVRENLAPEFTNTESIPSSMRVGCYDVESNIVNLSWRDPNNVVSYPPGDVVTFTHQGTEDVDWLNFDIDNPGRLFCVSAPENGDAGVISISMTLEDDRPSRPLTKEYSFDLEILANDAPEFNNLEGFPVTFNAGETESYTVEWTDPNSDGIDFSVNEHYYSWLDVEGNGFVELSPTLNDTGSYEITFNIFDGCYEESETVEITIE